MRTLLQIGEIAQLLGVTPKTIRHYQKVGLIAEPERTEAGYRLYNAQHLLRLQRIRRLQALGLSLKQIKSALGDPSQEHTLREVLQALDEELADQIQMLEERRKKIKTLLEENRLETLDSPSLNSPTFQLVKEELAEHHSNVSPAFWEQEAQLYAHLDNFYWTEDQQKLMKEMSQRFIEHVTEHPEEYQQLLGLGERFVALASLPEDDPQVKQLAEDFKKYFEKYPFLQELGTQIPHLASPLEHTFSELVTPIYSPAQMKVLKAIESRNALTSEGGAS